jgi:hypothetical protein
MLSTPLCMRLQTCLLRCRTVSHPPIQTGSVTNEATPCPRRETDPRWRQRHHCGRHHDKHLSQLCTETFKLNPESRVLPKQFPYAPRQSTAQLSGQRR